MEQIILRRKLIRIKDCYYVSSSIYSNLCYHKKKKEILNVTGVGEKSGEVHHNKGWNKLNEVLFIDKNFKISKKEGKKIFKDFKIKKKKVINIELCYEFNCNENDELNDFKELIKILEKYTYGNKNNKMSEM